MCLLNLFVKTYYVFTSIILLNLLNQIFLISNLNNFLTIYSIQEELNFNSFIYSLGTSLSIPNLNSYFFLIGFLLLIKSVLNRKIHYFLIFILIYDINIFLLEPLSINLDFLYKNLLLSNSLNLIHPPTLYLSWGFSVFIVFLQLVSRNYIDIIDKKTLLIFKNNLLYATLYLIVTLGLGSFWAWQTGTWGGWWVWDYSEVLLLVLVFNNINLIHKKNNVLTKQFLFLFIIYIYWIVTFKLIDISLHTFFSNNVDLLKFSLLQYFIYFLLINIFLQFYINNLKINHPPSLINLMKKNTLFILCLIAVNTFFDWQILLYFIPIIIIFKYISKINHYSQYLHHLYLSYIILLFLLHTPHVNYIYLFDSFYRDSIFANFNFSFYYQQIITRLELQTKTSILNSNISVFKLIYKEKNTTLFLNEQINLLYIKNTKIRDLNFI